MEFAFGWTFALVIGWPGTIAAALWAAYLSHSRTEGATTRDAKKIRAVAYLAAAIAIAACLGSFALWTSGFDEGEQGMSQSVDRALWVGQLVTAAGLLLAVCAAVSARRIRRRTDASH